MKYLPQMPDKTQRRHLFVAIDRATRWVYFRLYRDQTEASSTDFLRRLKVAAPMKIQKVLTDNAVLFTDRFTGKDRVATSRHAFDAVCVAPGIQHRVCPPRHPQTNGRVERFNGHINGRIGDLAQANPFRLSPGVGGPLTLYLTTHNHTPSRNAP